MVRRIDSPNVLEAVTTKRSAGILVEFITPKMDNQDTTDLPIQPKICLAHLIFELDCAINNDDSINKGKGILCIVSEFQKMCSGSRVRSTRWSRRGVLLALHWPGVWVRR